MSDLPKQELDELFREGADMQNFEYNSAAWNKMEAKLDASERRRRAIFWIFFLSGITTVVLIIILGLPGNSKIAKKQDAKLATQLNTNSPSSSIGIVQTEILPSEGLVTELNVNKTAKNVVPLDLKYSVEKSETNRALNNSSNINTVQQISFDTSLSFEVTPSNVGINTEEKEIQSENKAAVQLQISALARYEISNIKTQKNYLKSDISTIDVMLVDYEDQDISISRRLSYSIFAAPEWSSIGFDGPREMGYKIGANIGFQVSEKLEIRTGLSLSQKKFNGEGSQFTEAGGWVDDIMPMTMEAKCNILEFPLDAVYHFNGVSNNGFVASIGYRGYMLHSEWYGFEYDPLQYKPGVMMDEKTIPNPTKKWAGSIELSLGYNRKVGSQLSTQITPYLQIPTTKFGDGKINLFSGGVKFVLRFDR